MKTNWWIGRAIKGVLFVTLAVLVCGYAVMMLWNWLIPELFHGPTVGLVQAFGLLILTKILFGGFKGGWGGGGGNCGCGNNRRNRWRARMEARLEKMSPEEREKVREKWSRCGWDYSFKEKKAE